MKIINSIKKTVIIASVTALISIVIIYFASNIIFISEALFSVAFFSIINIYVKQSMFNTIKNRPNLVPAAFLKGTTIKLLGAIIIIVAYFFVKKESIVYFVMMFALHYIVFSYIEIKELKQIMLEANEQKKAENKDNINKN